MFLVVHYTDVQWTITHTYTHTPKEVCICHSGDFNDEDQMRKMNHLITQYKL